MSNPTSLELSNNNKTDKDDIKCNCGHIYNSVGNNIQNMITGIQPVKCVMKTEL